MEYQLHPNQTGPQLQVKKAMQISAMELESSWAQRQYFPPEKARGPLLLIGIPFPFGHIDLLLRGVNGG